MNMKQGRNCVGIWCCVGIETQNARFKSFLAVALCQNQHTSPFCSAAEAASEVVTSSGEASDAIVVVGLLVVGE
jgi:uncharacterized metal-binding protein